MQAVLSALAADCAERGISVLTPDDIRQTGLREAILRDVQRPGIENVRRRVALVDALRRYGAAGATLVISEENIFGDADGLLVNPVYPRMAVRSRNLRALAAAVETELFVAIRSWDDILPSAYATWLRCRPILGGFAGIRHAALARPPCWVEFVDRMTALFPGARLRLWLHEDYRAGAATVLNAMVGDWLADLPEIADPASTRTPSAAAVAQAEQMQPHLSMAERKAAVDALYQDDLLRNGAKFMPFSADERARLREAYEAQVAQLRARQPEDFLL
ncbi:hypothetical protein [Rubrimonas sp.]|uniref:hypothetical protein n=1 Tax=Rubrimonas sp. TaxID=2036015 RepID=UPI002FDD98C5